MRREEGKKEGEEVRKRKKRRVAHRGGKRYKNLRGTKRIDEERR